MFAEELKFPELPLMIKQSVSAADQPALWHTVIFREKFLLTIPRKKSKPDVAGFILFQNNSF